MCVFFSPEVVSHVFRYHSIHISIPCIIIIAERNQFFIYSHNADTGCYKITRYTYLLIAPTSLSEPCKTSHRTFLCYAWESNWRHPAYKASVRTDSWKDVSSISEFYKISIFNPFSWFLTPFLLHPVHIVASHVKNKLSTFRILWI